MLFGVIDVVSIIKETSFIDIHITKRYHLFSHISLYYAENRNILVLTKKNDLQISETWLTRKEIMILTNWLTNTMHTISLHLSDRRSVIF